MSRGLGVTERAVAACIAQCKQRSARTDAFYTAAGQKLPPNVVQVNAWAVCMQINPLLPGELRDWKRPTEAQLKAAKRAMHSFAQKFPEYGVVSGKGGRGRLYLYERGGKLSAMWAKLRSQSSRGVILDDARNALAHVEARRNEPFKVQKKRYVEYRKRKLSLTDPRPQVFKDLDLTNAQKKTPALASRGASCDGKTVGTVSAPATYCFRLQKASPILAFGELLWKITAFLPLISPFTRNAA